MVPVPAGEAGVMDGLASWALRRAKISLTGKCGNTNPVLRSWLISIKSDNTSYGVANVDPSSLNCKSLPFWGADCRRRVTLQGLLYNLVQACTQSFWMQPLNLTSINSFILRQVWVVPMSPSVVSNGIFLQQKGSMAFRPVYFLLQGLTPTTSNAERLCQAASRPGGYVSRGLGDVWFDRCLARHQEVNDKPHRLARKVTHYCKHL